MFVKTVGLDFIFLTMEERKRDGANQRHSYLGDSKHWQKSLRPGLLSFMSILIVLGHIACVVALLSLLTFLIHSDLSELKNDLLGGDLGEQALSFIKVLDVEKNFG